MIDASTFDSFDSFDFIDINGLLAIRFAMLEIQFTFVTLSVEGSVSNETTQLESNEERLALLLKSLVLAHFRELI
jgi:hypothetical protein